MSLLALCVAALALVCSTGSLVFTLFLNVYDRSTPGRRWQLRSRFPAWFARSLEARLR